VIFTDKRVHASGPKSAKLAAIGMAPAKQELIDGKPLVGPSGRIFDEALIANKIGRPSVFVTNLCEFYIDDNDLYSVPREVMERERERVFKELDSVKPNCLLIMGVQTLVLLKEGYVGPYGSKAQRAAAAKWGITKWRGSILSLPLPSGRVQKCVVAMHPASFLRGQWKWFPLFKYIDVKRAVAQSSFSEIRLTERRTIVPTDVGQAIEYLANLEKQEWVSIDYEGRKHLSVLGVGSSPNEAMSIPLSRSSSSRYWSLENEAHIWKAWTHLLENQNVKKIAQNAAFEWIKSWLYGIYPRNLGIDTMHAHHCLYPDFGGISDEWEGKKRDIDNPGHGLALLTSQYTDQPYYKDDGRHWTTELGELRFWEYNGTDVMVTYEVGMKMLAELKSLGLWEAYVQQYRDPFEKCMQMEWMGINQDLEKRAFANAVNHCQIEEIRAELKTLTGLDVITKANGSKPNAGTLNLGSPKQLGTWLKARGYKAQIKYDKKTKKAKESWDKEVIAKLVIDHPKDRALRLIAEVNKKQDFHDKVIAVKMDEYGRLHCHWKLGGTNGTRWSSAKSILDSGQNLQNLPRTGVARHFFLPN